jgi:hypothetical protein
MVQSRVIGGFTIIVAVFLAYQIGLNFKAYHFAWACWDYRLISGCLGFIVAMPMNHVTLTRYRSLIGGEVLVPFGTYLLSQLG